MGIPLGQPKEKKEREKEMTLPGVGVFAGENTAALVAELRRAGFAVRVIWAPGRKMAERLKRELQIEHCTTDIKELVIRSDVDLVIIDSPPPTHSQIANNALRIGKHVVCSLPAGLNLSDAKKMIQASHYYPTLLAAASSPLRFLEQIQHIRTMIRSGRPGRVQVVEAKLKDNLTTGESWRLDNRMGGGSLSLLAAYVTDTVSHILSEQATRVHSFSVRSPHYAACDTFTALHLQFPSGAACSANVAFSNYFEFELIFTCTNGTIRLDSELNVTTVPEEAIVAFDGRRTESVIESDDTEPETVNEETANETEVETQEKTAEEPGTTTADHDEAIEEDDEPKPPKMIDQATQIAVERRNAKTETSCGLVGATGLSDSISAKGLPILVDSIKNAFIDGGYDPRAWDQMTLDATPVANFADVLYIQGVLDAARRSDRSGEWESVDVGDEFDSSLKFQHEMSLYCEVIDQLQI